MKTEYIKCSCTTPEHTLHFSFHETDKDSVYLHYFLENGVWYKRLWFAVKYLFGYKCRYGHFGETVIEKEQAEKIISILSNLKSTEITKESYKRQEGEHDD
jgi:hypothetical protein